MNFKKSVDNNKLKKDLVTSIQKNDCCLDFLTNLQNKYEDIYNYSNNDNDRKNIEMLKWIGFQMAYLEAQYLKTLKQIGGNPNAIQPIEWQ